MPSGNVTGHSEEKLGGAAACAVKRIHLDARIAKCAQRTGATLLEGFEVTKGNTTFDKSTGLWTVTSSAVSHASTPKHAFMQLDGRICIDVLSE